MMIRGSVIHTLWGVFFILSGPAFSQSAPNTQSIESHAHQAQQDLQSGKPAEAITELNAILALDPNNLNARANVGVLQFFGGDYAKAIQNLRSALKLKPDSWKLQALLGMAEKRTGENVSAQSDLEKAFPHLQEQKLKIEAGMELIELDYAQSDLGKAAEVINALRQAKPEDVDILYTAHRIYSALADETTLSLALLAPDSARMKQLMAHELARQAKNDAAITRYREAIKIDPKRSDLHFELAEMLNTSSSEADKAEAEKEYKAALAENPFDEKSVCRLGDIALRRADMKAASAYYTKALQMQPNDAEANLGLARVLMSQRQPKEAQRYLEHAVQLEPFDPAAHYRLSVLDRELGRADEARLQLQEFQKYKKMKSRLSDLYQEMRLSPGKQTQTDSDVPQ
jgi:cytochrome c-type biogenesis protein CcmH/NrfG